MSSHLIITENPETYDQYLQYISDLDLSPRQKFELLYIVNAILSYFVDQAFGVQTDQITLQSIGKDFTGSFNHGMISGNPENQTDHALSHGVEPDSNPMGRAEP
jgi:hypothetical protein